MRLNEHGTPVQSRTIGNISSFPIGKKHNASLKPAIFSTHPSNPIQDAIDYNRVILKRRKKQVEKLLREIELSARGC